jgi:predicted transposase YbfD/YdcC
LVTVKGNQPKLMQQFHDALAEQTPLSVAESLDTSHGRQVKRVVQVFAAPPAVAALWKQAQSLVVVERSGVREDHPFETTSFYLSSLPPNALELGLGIRAHRDIENGLHWVRDVVFKEDAAPFVDLRTALNWSLIRTIALNLFRANGYPSLTRAIRLLGNDLCGLLSLLTKN